MPGNLFCEPSVSDCFANEIESEIPDPKSEIALIAYWFEVGDGYLHLQCAAEHDGSVFGLVYADQRRGCVERYDENLLARLGRQQGLAFFLRSLALGLAPTDGFVLGGAFGFRRARFSAVEFVFPSLRERPVLREQVLERKLFDQACW